MKYHATFERRFKVEIDAPDIATADKLARKVEAEIGDCRLVSIYVDGYVQPPDDPAPTPVKPRNTPPSGSPGTPVVKEEILVDQIAVAA